jgi:hypothetical protein
MESLTNADPFYELSALSVRNVCEAFCDPDRATACSGASELDTKPGCALTINWKGPSIVSLKTMHAPEELNVFDADDVLKRLSVQLQSGSFPCHTGRVVGNFPNGAFVHVQRSPDGTGIERPICFFISKVCFISLNEYGIALISVPHESVVSQLSPGAGIVPLTCCIIARKLSGQLEFNVCAELGVLSDTAIRPQLDDIHQNLVPLAALLNDLRMHCSTNAAFTREVARVKMLQHRVRSKLLPLVLQIAFPYLTLPSKMHLLAVCKTFRKLTVEHFRETRSCDAVSAQIAPSRLNHFLVMHEQLTSLSLNVAKNNYSFNHILVCAPTLVNLTALHLHNLQTMADADVAHVLRACKQLRVVELNNATHVGALSLLALASSCRHLRRCNVSSSHASIVNDLLTRELSGPCFSAPLQALEFPLCCKYSLTAIRHIVTNFGGAMLSVLDLSGCLHLGDAGICSIVTICTRLETFIAKFSPASDATCQALSKCSNLELLDLSGSLPSRKGLVSLAPLASSLRSISLSRCTVVNDANLCELLWLLPNIKMVDIRGCPCISYSTILLLQKLAPHAAISHSIETSVALQHAAQVISFIQPLFERSEALK